MHGPAVVRARGRAGPTRARVGGCRLWTRIATGPTARTHLNNENMPHCSRRMAMSWELRLRFGLCHMVTGHRCDAVWVCRTTEQRCLRRGSDTHHTSSPFASRSRELLSWSTGQGTSPTASPLITTSAPPRLSSGSHCAEDPPLARSERLDGGLSENCSHSSMSARLHGRSSSTPSRERVDHHPLKGRLEWF